MNKRYEKYLNDSVFNKFCHAFIDVIKNEKLEFEDIDLIKEIVKEKLEVIENHRRNNTVYKKE